MLIGIVIGSIILALVLVFAVTYFLRRRRLRQAQTNDPYLSRKEFTRRRKMSKVDRMHEEELERRAIIRKSLASKASSRSSQAISEQMGIVDDDDDDGNKTGVSPTNSLKDDWKEWEARLQRERSNSIQEHPLMSPRTSIPIPTPIPIPVPPPQTTSRASVSDSRQGPHPATALPQLPPIPTA